MNKEVLAPNLQETSLVAMRLVHSSMQAAKCKVADFVVNDALLSSCAHARNRYQMYLMERKQKDSTAMKTLLVESNAARSRSEEIQKQEIPGQEKEIKKIEERIKKTGY